MVGAMCEVQLIDGKLLGGSNVWSTAHRQKDLWWDQGVEYSSYTERSMVGSRCGVQLIDRKIYGGIKVWSTAHRQKDLWWDQGVEYSS